MKGRSCLDLTASFGDDFGQFGGMFLSCWRDLACLLSLPTCFLSTCRHKSIWHRQRQLRRRQNAVKPTSCLRKKLRNLYQTDLYILIS
jgi:hypothetical protein